MLITLNPGLKKYDEWVSFIWALHTRLHILITYNNISTCNIYGMLCKYAKNARLTTLLIQCFPLIQSISHRVKKDSSIAQRVSLFHKDQYMLFNIVLKFFNYNGQTDKFLLSTSSTKAWSMRVQRSWVIFWNSSAHVFTNGLLYVADGTTIFFALCLYLLPFGTS